MKRLLLPLLAALALPTAVNAEIDEEKKTLDKASFIGIHAILNCLKSAERINNQQSKDILEQSLREDKLEYLISWGKGPEASRAILRLTKEYKGICDPHRLNKENVEKILSEI